MFRQLLLLLTLTKTLCHAQSRPNIVLFLADDLGIADIGCFGNATIKTPNIDRIASEGAKLAHNLAPESVCTPSRAAFLTGRYAIRSGLASNSDSIRMFLYLSVPGGLPQNETTFAEALRGVGYATGLIGKWHCGLNQNTSNDYHYHPLRHGFQHFYGLPLTNLRECKEGHFIFELLFPNLKRDLMYGSIVVSFTSIVLCVFGLLSKRSATVLCLLAGLIYGAFIFGMKVRRHTTCILMRDFDVVEQPIVFENLTARFTDDAINFIEQSHHNNNPFVVFMSYAKVHTSLFTTKPFEGHSVHGRYGDNVEEMDWSVGQIMNALDKLGIKDNTFVYFTSDHGPHLEESYNGEYQGGWRGIYKGGKGQSWEGGIRVPTVLSWPASSIPQGITINEPTNSMDVFPTILHIAGASIPQDRIIDGKNLMPLLQQQQKLSPHEFMFHYCAKEIHAVRYRPKDGSSVWKAHYKTPKWLKGKQECFGMCYKCYGDDVNTHNPPLLFEISADPSEDHPINPSDPMYEEVVKAIEKAVDEHKNSVDEVPNQLTKNQFSDRSFLQPCCNYPFCSCQEKVNIKHYPSNV